MRKLSLASLVLAACQTISSPLTESEPLSRPNTCTFTTINGIVLPPHKQYDHVEKEIVFEDLDWGWHLAESGYYQNGQPTVIYNATGMQRYPAEFQAFVFHHEIGHFKLRHFRSPLPDRITFLQREKEANCYAIDYFEDVLKCSPEQMKIIFEESLPYWFPDEVPGFKECLGK